MNLSEKVAVVTGAGSGIGRALSRELATKGASVAVCDINERAAKDTLSVLPSPQGPPHESFLVDVADRESVQGLASRVAGVFGGVDVLVNNAGVIGQIAPLEALEYEELQWVLNIDLWGVIYCTKEFLPHLKNRPEAALVNISSAAGLMGTLGNSAYFTAKFAVRGFSEAIQSELQRSNVNVTIVYPGIVKTNLAASPRSYSEAEQEEAVRRYHQQPGLSPERAAAKIVSGIEKKRARVLVGPDAWIVDKLARVAPAQRERLFHHFIVKMVHKQRPDGRKFFT